MGFLMNLIKSVIYGIVQGITEWLPISSTAHLIMMNSFMPLNLFEDAAANAEFWNLYKVVIQLGSILAVIFVYNRRLNPFQKKISAKRKSSILRMWTLILIAFFIILWYLNLQDNYKQQQILEAGGRMI